MAQPRRRRQRSTRAYSTVSINWPSLVAALRSAASRVKPAFSTPASTPGSTGTPAPPAGRSVARRRCVRPGPCRRAADAAAPVRHPQPVAELRGGAEDALARDRAYAARGIAVHLDGQLDARAGIGGDRQPELRVVVGIRMREAVRHVAPDPPVVGVAHQVRPVGLRQGRSTQPGNAVGSWTLMRHPSATRYLSFSSSCLASSMFCGSSSSAKRFSRMNSPQAASSPPQAKIRAPHTASCARSCAGP